MKYYTFEIDGKKAGYYKEEDVDGVFYCCAYIIENNQLEKNEFWVRHSSNEVLETRHGADEWRSFLQPDSVYPSSAIHILIDMMGTADRWTYTAYSEVDGTILGDRTLCRTPNRIEEYHHKELLRYFVIDENEITEFGWGAKAISRLVDSQEQALSQIVSITVDTDSTDKLISLFAVVDDSEWQLLNDYTQYADFVLHTKFVRQDMPSGLTIGFDSMGTLTFDTRLPDDWDEVIVLLYKIRPLLLQKEATNFYRVRNLLAKKFNHPAYREILDVLGTMYSGKLMHSVFKSSANGVVLNSEKTLMQWLNGFEYHKDKDKREYIESLLAIIPFDAAQVMFLLLLREKVEAILRLSIQIKVILGIQQQANQRVRTIS